VSRLVPCDYGKEIEVNDCVTIRFTDVGHLLGSACIETWLTEGGETRKMTFSGDIGNVNQPILKDPNHIADTEYLMIESTYGDRDHDAQRIDYVSDLAGIIQKTLDRGGNVVIPAFAVGRTQELLYFIREIKEKKLVTGHGDFPVYVDSPLAIEATSVFLQCDMEYRGRRYGEAHKERRKPHRVPRPEGRRVPGGVQGHKRGSTSPRSSFPPAACATPAG
jgi:metallo-beta-lactamase family protein